MNPTSAVVFFQPHSQQVALPSSRCRLEAFQLIEHGFQCLCAFLAVLRMQMLPAEQKIHELSAGDRSGSFASGLHAVAVNPSQQPGFTPFIALRAGSESAAQNKAFVFQPYQNLFDFACLDR